MSSLASIKTQIQTLITLANATTGNNDTDLTTCVNSLIAGYGQSSEPTPLFTNLVQQEGAWVKRNSRWSHSSQAWKSSTADDCVIIPVKYSTSSTIRIRGANQGSYITSTYFGETNEVFNVTGADSTITTQDNGDITIVGNAPITGYMTIHLAPTVDMDTLIITQNEEINYA